MRERRIRHAIEANAAAKAVPASVLVCVVLTSGALFGMAAQSALDHYGLGLATIRDHLIVDPVAQSRSALAWWAWWLAAFAAFFVGPLSIAATQSLVADWWLLRRLRILAFGALVLGLAAIGHLPAAPSTFDVRAGAVVGAAVALLSAALAALGARSIRAAARRRNSMPGLDHGCSRAFDPVAAPPPRPGGGSVDSGLLLRPLRPGHSLVRGLGRLAFAGALGLVMLAAVSALTGAVVGLELGAPGTVRHLLAAAPAPDLPVHTVPVPETQVPATQTWVMAFAPLPPGEAPPAHIAIVATIPESELTFAKGYVQRRAAREAAEIVTAALQFQITVPDKLRSRAATLQHVEHDGHPRPHRRVSERPAQDRYQGDRQAAPGSSGVHRRYAAYDPPDSHRRRSAENHLSNRTRHGDRDRYAGYDHNRFAGF